MSVSCYDLDGNPIDHFEQFGGSRVVSISGFSGHGFPCVDICGSFGDVYASIWPDVTTSGFPIVIPSELIERGEPIVLYARCIGDGVDYTFNEIRIPVAIPSPFEEDDESDADSGDGEQSGIDDEAEGGGT